MLSKDSVDVSTEYGTIRGCKKVSVLGRNYFNFQRIPYMKPPVGKLRFVDPQEPEKWTEPLDCTEHGPAFCNVNFLTEQYEGELDSMHVNVYTVDMDPKKPLPVMVWIHGGGVYTGNARTELTSPDYLMQKDVVLVTFHYRMGVFGFLSLDDPSLNIPGNAQFRDHVFALKWIKRNIGRFGGDANNVTVFGESWGGGSTSYHMISKQSKNLFHRGILMSGTALNGVYSLIPRRDWALRLCHQLGYDGSSDDKSLLEFLENADEKEIILASPKIMTDKEQEEEGLIVPFGPCIEPYDNGNAFITDHIIKMAKNCWGNEIDIMIGATSNELGALDMMANVESEFKKYINFKRYIPFDLGIDVDDPKRSEYAERIMRNYYGLLQPSRSNLEGTMRAGNDFALWHPIHRIVKSRENSGKGGKSFVYRFDFNSENNFFKKLAKAEDTSREAFHGDDVGYIFKMDLLGPTPPVDSVGFAGIRLMLSTLTEFARTGNPNVNEFENVEWLPATFDVPLKGLNINEKQSKFIVLPEATTVHALDKLYHEQKKDLY
ncbi:CLUMA_CG007033, isoform A [Clunio marinus]|uniref:carboxylesterase n=1 Tax=Clunio marinus TaxID=568069 RepID=A0A1J1I544_9DIPT|nr:CLUMA_CG007033, isoform A [Clunio marinus]